MDWAQIGNTAASAVLVVVCLVFVTVYHLRAPWRSSAVGRHLMTFTAAIGALGAYTVAITIWETGVPAAVLRTSRTLLVLVIAGLVIQRTRMVLAAQHRPVDRERDRSGPHTR